MITPFISPAPTAAVDASAVDHGALAGLGDDDHTQYMNAARLSTALAATDHGVLAGLGDDDHTQYLRTDGSRALAGNLTISGSGRSISVTSSDEDIAIRGNRLAASTTADVVLGGKATRTTAGAKLVSIQNNTTEKAYFDKDGQLIISSSTLGTSSLNLANSGGTTSTLTLSGNRSWLSDWTTPEASTAAHRIQLSGGYSYHWKGGRAGADAGADHYFDTVNTRSGSAKIVAFMNNGTIVSSIDHAGNISPSGSVYLAAAQRVYIGGYSALYHTASNTYLSCPDNYAVIVKGRLAAGAAGADVTISSDVTRTTPGKILAVNNNATEVASVNYAGILSATGASFRHTDAVVQVGNGGNSFISMKPQSRALAFDIDSCEIQWGPYGFGTGDPTDVSILRKAAGVLMIGGGSANATSTSATAGRLVAGAPNSAIADGTLVNSSYSAYVDQTANTLIFKVKYSTGTVKTGTVSLV